MPFSLFVNIFSEFTKNIKDFGFFLKKIKFPIEFFYKIR